MSAEARHRRCRRPGNPGTAGRATRAETERSCVELSTDEDGRAWRRTKESHGHADEEGRRTYPRARKPSTREREHRSGKRQIRPLGSERRLAAANTLHDSRGAGQGRSGANCDAVVLRPALRGLLASRAERSSVWGSLSGSGLMRLRGPCLKFGVRV